MTTDELLRDLIDIPESVHKSDFVISLNQSITTPEQTVESYEVTSQLADCFDRALSLITTATESSASKGAYLHGSFGAGKSHFMAVLHLLLSGNQKARSKPELAPVIAKYDPRLQGRRFLLVPIHMIGQTSMESGVLGRYVDHVREIHPEAPLPAVYLADQVFEDAQALRERMGDDQFFSALGSGGDDALGDLAAGWDQSSFEAALDASPGSADRDRLIGDLVDAYFSAYKVQAEATGEGFVTFDEGLEAISRHAKGLGYDGVVLFLDELILWFATLMAESAFVSREGPKVAKLVEAGTTERPVPIISFIARQRDLRDFIGQGIPGAERLGFGDILDWWEGRFDTIELSDRNLVTIVERRVLKPRSEAARQQLDAAFEATVLKAGPAVDTLLTSDADREMFRRVYPFSPALIETLIAVSGYLQRERTALRLLVQLLVDRRDRLTIGDLVPLGDLYDVISRGDEPFSQELRRHFRRAQDLYERRFRPLLLETHGLDEGQAEGIVDSHPFRTDDRLVKTLLLAALVPEVEPLRGLTARRLAEVNHGTIRTPIPGQERAAVLTRVKRWAAEIGELRVEGDEQDPTVSLRLTGVDTASILDRARASDNVGARRAKVREIMAEALGVELGGGLAPALYNWAWRGSRRAADVRFANVREQTDIPDSEFQSTDRPKVIVDYPFDEGGYSPADDLARVEELVERGGGGQTVCWLPVFLTERALDRLGDLVVMEHVLAGDRFDGYTTHLSPQDRAESRHLLDNQARQLREQVKDFLRQAYGLTAPDEQWVRGDTSPQQQFPSLDGSLTIQPPTAASLKDAFEQVLDQVMRHWLPKHPLFEDEVRPADLRACLTNIQRALQNKEHRTDVPQPERKAVRKILGPLRLADTGEAHLVMRRDWFDLFEIKRPAHTGPLTVEILRRWIDEPEPYGLDERVANLIISAYALQSNQILRHGGSMVEPSTDRLDPAVELVTLDLPNEEEWKVATERAAAVFGLTASPLRSSTTVGRLGQDLRAVAAKYRDPVNRLVDQLNHDKEHLALTDQAPRVVTTRVARELLKNLHGSTDVDAIRVLAAAQIPTSSEAIGRVIVRAEATVLALQNTNWDLIELAATQKGSWEKQAKSIAERLQEGGTADEIAVALEGVLANASHAATDLMKRVAPSPQPRTGDLEPSGRKSNLKGDEATQVLQKLLSHRDVIEELSVSWRLRNK